MIGSNQKLLSAASGSASGGGFDLNNYTLDGSTEVYDTYASEWLRLRFDDGVNSTFYAPGNLLMAFGEAQYGGSGSISAYQISNYSLPSFGYRANFPDDLNGFNTPFVYYTRDEIEPWRYRLNLITKNGFAQYNYVSNFLIDDYDLPPNGLNALNQTTAADYTEIEPIYYGTDPLGMSWVGDYSNRFLVAGVMDISVFNLDDGYIDQPSINFYNTSYVNYVYDAMFTQNGEVLVMYYSDANYNYALSSFELSSPYSISGVGTTIAPSSTISPLAGSTATTKIPTVCLAPDGSTMFLAEGNYGTLKIYRYTYA